MARCFSTAKFSLFLWPEVHTEEGTRELPMIGVPATQRPLHQARLETEDERRELQRDSYSLSFPASIISGPQLHIDSFFFEKDSTLILRVQSVTQVSPFPRLFCCTFHQFFVNALLNLVDNKTDG